MKITAVIILVIVSINTLFSETGYKFLNISPSPLHIASGEPVSLSLNSASAFYYNPALLAMDEYEFFKKSYANRVDLFFSYITYFEGVRSLSFFSILDLEPLNKIAVGFNNLYYGDILNTFYNNADSYSVAGKKNLLSYYFIFGYGFNIHKQLGMGINLKIPHEDLGTESHTGIGGDLGLIFKKQGFQAGLVLDNAGFDHRSDVRHALPMRIKMGTSYGFYFFNQNFPKTHRLIFSLDPGKEWEGNYYINTGWQYGYKNRLFLRNGYHIEEEYFTIRLGCGFQYKKFKINYSFQSEELGNIHSISLESGFSPDSL